MNPWADKEEVRTAIEAKNTNWENNLLSRMIFLSVSTKAVNDDTTATSLGGKIWQQGKKIGIRPPDPVASRLEASARTFSLRFFRVNAAWARSLQLPGGRRETDRATQSVRRSDGSARKKLRAFGRKGEITGPRRRDSSEERFWPRLGAHTPPVKSPRGRSVKMSLRPRSDACWTVAYEKRADT